MENYLKKPIFILGLRRSGSTLWLNILAKNPNILRIGEMYFLDLWRRDFRYFCVKFVGNLSDDKNIKKMIELIFSDNSVEGLTGYFWSTLTGNVNNQKLKHQIYKKIIESDRTTGSIFRVIIEEITTFKNHNRCCIKFPVDIYYISQLLKWYPECKIIHLMRDPRATAISRINYQGGRYKKLKKNLPLLSNLIKKLLFVFISLEYILASKIHAEYKKKRNYKLFIYEDLIVNPRKIIDELCKFVELDFHPAMLNPREGQRSSVTGNQSRSFDKDAGKRWKKIITPFDNIIVTYLTRKSMKRFGYNPNEHPIFLNDDQKRP